MKKIIRVLQINIGSQNFGGVSSMIYNLYSHIDRSEVQFDFLSPNITTYEMHRDEIEKMGGAIYEFHIPIKGTYGKYKYFRKLGNFLKEKSYDIVHINSGSPGFNVLSLMAAKLYCQSKVIVHSHNAPVNKSKSKKIFYSLCAGIMNRYADLRFACSIAAGRFMFGSEENFQVINNGIELNKFKFDENIRKKVRSKFLGTCTNKIVFGFVGRLEDQKNPEFAIKCFAEISRLKPDVVLWIIGHGQLENQIVDMIYQYNLSDKVTILGERTDVAELMQGMDAILFPSKYEGLGIVAIEAQSSGLRIYASDNLPEESKVNDCIQYISIEKTPEEWAKIIVNDLEINAEQERGVPLSDNFNIETISRTINKKYKALLGGVN
ncbi:MAG: glycosyltransferase [Lachnospiraceae bacterium]|nr:glycosyltransferase [Lachnospiraceae bacterium]